MGCDIEVIHHLPVWPGPGQLLRTLVTEICRLERIAEKSTDSTITGKTRQLQTNLSVLRKKICVVQYCELQ